MNDYEKTISMLKVISLTMEEMAAEANQLCEKLVEIRKRSEDTEHLVNECLTLIGK